MRRESYLKKKFRKNESHPSNARIVKHRELKMVLVFAGMLASFLVAISAHSFGDERAAGVFAAGMMATCAGLWAMIRLYQASGSTDDVRVIDNDGKETSLTEWNNKKATESL